MVNDDVNNKAINLEIKVAQYSSKAISKAMKKIIEDAVEKRQPLADYLSEKRKIFLMSKRNFMIKMTSY